MKLFHSHLVGFCISIVLLLCAALVGYAKLGSFRTVLAVAGGNSVVVSVSEIKESSRDEDNSDGSDQAFEVTLVIKNLSSSKVRLLGHKFSCDCARIDALTSNVGPFETVHADVKVNVNAPVCLTGFLYTDRSDQRSIPFEINVVPRHNVVLNDWTVSDGQTSG